MKNKISVIIPVYNAEKYLSRCIDSILRQSYANFELLLIDDGSVDNSARICDDYQLSDNRIFVVHKKNSGVSATRNVGLDLASGQYITFVDADDYVSDNYLEILISNIEDEIGMIIGSAQKIINDSHFCDYKVYEKKEKVVFSNEYDIRQWYRQSEVWGTLIRKDIISNIRFADDLYVGEDLLFISQAIKQSKIMKFLPDIIYYYNVAEESAYYGKFNEKKYTEIIAWERVIRLFDDYPNVQKTCYGRYFHHIIEIYKKIFAAGEQKNWYTKELSYKVRKNKQLICMVKNESYRMHLRVLSVNYHLYNCYLRLILWKHKILKNIS